MGFAKWSLNSTVKHDATWHWEPTFNNMPPRLPCLRLPCEEERGEPLAFDCVIDDRPNHFCESDDDCNEGAVCRNYVCRSPCTTNEECPRFDVSLTFCLDNVCATTNEATSDCAEASDCMTGQSCIDGICRS